MSEPLSKVEVSRQKIKAKRFLPMKSFIIVLSLITPFRVPIFGIFLFSFAWSLWDNKTVYKLIIIHSVIWVLMSYPIYVAIFESMNSIFIENLIAGSYSMALTFLFYSVFFGGLIFTQFIIIAYFSKLTQRYTKKYVTHIPGVETIQ
jgi:hypothetical protein